MLQAMVLFISERTWIFWCRGRAPASAVGQHRDLARDAGRRMRLCATDILNSCSSTRSIVSMISFIEYGRRSAIQ